jgi:hypothetical protein
LRADRVGGGEQVGRVEAGGEHDPRCPGVAQVCLAAPVPAERLERRPDAGAERRGLDDQLGVRSGVDHGGLVHDLARPVGGGEEEAVHAVERRADRRQVVEVADRPLDAVRELCGGVADERPHSGATRE